MRSKKVWQLKKRPNWVSWNSCREKDGDVDRPLQRRLFWGLETQNKRTVLPLMFFILASFLLSTNEKIYLQGQRHSPNSPYRITIPWAPVLQWALYSVTGDSITHEEMRAQIPCFSWIRTRRESSNWRCCATVSGCYSLCRKFSLYIHPV